MAFELSEVHEKTKRQEAELEAIYENAPIIMLPLDGDRRVQKGQRLRAGFAGALREDMTGLRSAEAIRCINALESPAWLRLRAALSRSAGIPATLADTLETGAGGHENLEATLPILHGRNSYKDFHFLSLSPLCIEGNLHVLVSLMILRKESWQRRRSRRALPN